VGVTNVTEVSWLKIYL